MGDETDEGNFRKIRVGADGAVAGDVRQFRRSAGTCRASGRRCEKHIGESEGGSARYRPVFFQARIRIRIPVSFDDTVFDKLPENSPESEKDRKSSPVRFPRLRRQTGWRPIRLMVMRLIPFRCAGRVFRIHRNRKRMFR